MPKHSGECTLCGDTKNLVKSHVFPQALHKDFQGEGNGVAELWSLSEPYTKKSPTGVYSRFLCHICESSFGPYDEYGVKFVQQYKNGTTGEPLFGSFDKGFIAQVDYAKLKLWLMSMLWKADQSNEPFFAQVDLGEKWRKDLTSRIQNESPLGSADYAVSAMKFEDQELRGIEDIWDKYLSCPFPQRCAGVNFYRFYIFGGFIFLIKVDQRRPPRNLEPLILSEGEPFVVRRHQPTDGEKKVFGKCKEYLSGLPGGGRSAIGPCRKIRAHLEGLRDISGCPAS